MKNIKKRQQKTIPIGVRLRPDQIQALAPYGSARQEIIRNAVDSWLNTNNEKTA